MKILIIEDDDEIISFLKSSLTTNSYVVDGAKNGKEGLQLAEENIYDLIILDLNLPDLSGLDVCLALRTNKVMTPILVLSAEENLETKINLLNHGADDYMTKPFSLEELIARIKALSRRPLEIRDTLLVVDDIELNRQNQTLRRDGEEIYLTRKEFLLLEFMMNHGGVVISRGEIMEHVWDMEANFFSKAIETHILNLRRKIDSNRANPLIKTISGRGYRFN